MSSKPTVLVAGASSGIGAIYADGFAKRGHDLVLTARSADRHDALATRLGAEAGVSVDVIQADVTAREDIVRIEARLRDDEAIGILINNAGAALAGSFVDQTPEQTANLIALNITAPTRLAAAVGPRFARAGSGAIVNIGSVVGLAPEFGMTVYGATKSYMLFLSQGLAGELGPKGVYVQAVLPAATRTEIWERSGRDVNSLQGVMETADLVDAALVGFDRREAVTIPPLPDADQWVAHEAARTAMIPNFAQSHAAARYRASA